MAREENAPSKPRINCSCAPKRTRENCPPGQAPLADSYTCSRPRPVEVPPVEERCTCKVQSARTQCECAPPVAPPPVKAQEPPPPAQPTHAYINCGQSVSCQRNTYQPKPSTQQPQLAQCGHCSANAGGKKKCVIQ